MRFIQDENIIEHCLIGGKWTSNKEALTELADLGYSEAVDILEYRNINGYVKNIKSMLERVHRDGRIRPRIDLGKTNRINYIEPALMNINRDILWDVVGPRNKTNNVLISVGIKQQEPWILVNMLGIESLREMISTGEDLYEQIYYDILSEKPNEIQRNELKTTWNALTYGASKMAARKMCRTLDGDKVYKYFNDIPEFKEYKKECYVMSKRNEQKAYTYFGTELYAEEYGTKLTRVLMDMPIQGTGADILALLIERFENKVHEMEIENFMELYFTRHDELIIEVDREYFDEQGEEKVKNTLRDIFEHQVDDWEPFLVEINRLNDLVAEEEREKTLA